MLPDNWRAKYQSTQNRKSVYRESLMRTYLQVPYVEKDKAKGMGARFDMSRKEWYVPDGVDLVPFLKWVPNVPKLSKRLKKTLAQNSSTKK